MTRTSGNGCWPSPRKCCARKASTCGRGPRSGSAKGKTRICPRGRPICACRQARHKALRGRFSQLVAPLIDGKRSADEIAEQLEDRLSAAEVYYTLRHLEKKGYIGESNGHSRAAHRTRGQNGSGLSFVVRPDDIFI